MNLERVSVEAGDSVSRPEPDDSGLIFLNGPDLIVAQPIFHRVVGELSTIAQCHSFLVASEPESPSAVLEDGSDPTGKLEARLRLACPRSRFWRTVCRYLASISCRRSLTRASTEQRNRQQDRPTGMSSSGFFHDCLGLPDARVKPLYSGAADAR
jgi:hypothetical protein